MKHLYAPEEQESRNPRFRPGKATRIARELRLVWWPRVWFVLWHLLIFGAMIGLLYWASTWPTS